MNRSLQIVLMGFEWDRIMYGLKEYPPRKAVLVCPLNDKSKKKWADMAFEIAKKVKENVGNLIETEIVYVNYYDFYDCIHKLANLMEENKGKYDNILMNISTGTRIASTAAVLISQYYPVELFYVVPQKYNLAENVLYLSSGAKEIVKLPTFNIKELVIPTKRQKKIFEQLEEEEVSLSYLIKKYSEVNNLNPSKRQIADLRSLLFYHLKKLREKRLVDMHVEGKSLCISLTNTGKLVRRIMEKDK
jgi:hypothetical protein